MKIAVTSSSFAALLRRGSLTHLEWLEACASRLDADGAVFALADFPRTDGEYAAQVKKVATDLGIVPVALDVPGLLDPQRQEIERTAALALAASIGAALIRVTAGPPGELPPETFARTVAATKAFTSAAKAANITIVVSPDAGTLLPDDAAIQNFSKYVDSAWLRDRVRGWVILGDEGGGDPFAHTVAAIAALRDVGQRPQMPSVVPG